MKKQTQIKPKLVSIADRHGDDITPALRAQEVIDGDRISLQAATVLEDFQSVRRLPLDAPMVIHMPPNHFGRISAMIFLLIAAFIAGLIVGKVL